MITEEKICPVCKGEPIKICIKCNGAGTIIDDEESPFLIKKVCSICEGKGKIICGRCQGKGKI